MKSKANAIRDVNRLFDTLLTIQKTRENEGSEVIIGHYEDYTQVWAEKRDLKGRNFYSARAANVKTDVEFVTRYRTDLTEDMRVVSNMTNKIYHIEGIVDLDQSRTLMIIKCYEIEYDQFG